MARQQQNTRSNAVSQANSEGGGCSEDYILYQIYNIRVTGVNSCLKKKVILDAISKVYSYTGLKEKLGNDPLTIANIDDNNKNWAYTFSKGLIRLYRFETEHTDEKWKFIITHELFHILSQRNEKNLNYPYDKLSLQDGNCFKSSGKGASSKTYISTYITSPQNQIGESFAESGALYIWDKSPLSPNEIYSFRQQCPNSYRWFQENVFKRTCIKCGS